MIEHKKIFVFGIVFMIGYFFCAFQIKNREPFPFLECEFFSRGSSRVMRYNIMITSLQQGSKLQHPIRLSDIKREFRQDWHPWPVNIISRFAASVNNIRNRKEFDKSKALLENFLRDYDYVEYDLIKQDYSPIDAVHDKNILDNYQVVKSFIMQRK